MGITHAKVSEATEGSDPNKVRTSDWNADHVVTAADIPIVDTGGKFTGTNVETALQEAGSGTATSKIYAYQNFR